MAVDSSVGSLTTTFTPVPSCLTDIYRFNASHTYSEDSQIKTFQYTNLGPTTTLGCLPSGFEPTSVYYSPGICPSGYGQACSSIISVGSNTETRATCCPLGYACQTETQNPWPWYSTELCTIAFFGGGAQTLHITSSLSPGSTTTFTTTMNGGLNAYGISIRYQAGDFATITSSSSSSASSPYSSPSPSIIIVTTSAPTTIATVSPASGPSSSISSGAIAGIVIGIIALISIIAASVFLTRRYKLRQYSRPYIPESISQGTTKCHPQYGSRDALKYQQQAVEIGEGDVRHELPVGAASLQEMGRRKGGDL